MKMTNVLVLALVIWMTKKSSGSRIPIEFTGLSDILQSRIRRDDNYHVKCHQSGTGLFSFFAVPILLGDITIDFMNMIDVMVDVMVMATGEEGDGMAGNNNNNNNNNGEGGGGGDAGGGDAMAGNNNNNNNNNNNGRRRRSPKGVDKLRIIEEALESFEHQPSNASTVSSYEMMAKNHINQYFQTLKTRRNDPEDLNVLGPRLKNEAPRQVMVEYLALEFFGQLMQSFQDFKAYCHQINFTNAECAILDTDLDFEDVLKSL